MESGHVLKLGDEKINLDKTKSWEFLFDKNHYLLEVRDAEDHGDGYLDIVESGLVMNNITVLILGVAENSAIPATVLSHGEVPAFKTLPVACGQFRKILK